MKAFGIKTGFRQHRGDRGDVADVEPLFPDCRRHGVDEPDLIIVLQRDQHPEQVDRVEGKFRVHPERGEPVPCDEALHFERGIGILALHLRIANERRGIASQLVHAAKECRRDPDLRALSRGKFVQWPPHQIGVGTDEIEDQLNRSCHIHSPVDPGANTLSSRRACAPCPPAFTPTDAP